MEWLAAAIFCVAVLYFAIHHPVFRKVVLIILAAIVAAAALGGGYLYWENQRQAERSAYAKTLIAKADIDFFDMMMGNDHTVRGNVRNRSTHTLKAFKLQIIMQDCPEGKMRDHRRGRAFGSSMSTSTTAGKPLSETWRGFAGRCSRI